MTCRYRTWSIGPCRSIGAHHDPADVQRCALLSIKTGGCPEDCGYCAQSAHFKTGVKAEPLLTVAEVQERAEQARALGATRFCMGAAWREVKDGPQFDSVLEMVRTVRGLGMEACVTLGMLTDEQAGRLAEAGLTAYNHNLDTSRRHYDRIVTTRSYDDRLETLRAVQRAGISVCCGGILGMEETEDDRLLLLAELAALDPPPESIPINCLMPIPGTPLENAEPVDGLRAGATDRDDPDHLPGSTGASQRRPRPHGPRVAGALLPGGGQLDLLRREAADGAEPVSRGRCGAVPGDGLGFRARSMSDGLP